MESEQLRGLASEYFRSANEPLNYDRCAQEIAYKAKDRFPDLLNTDARAGHVLLSSSSHELLTEVLWDLILNRLLIPGNQGWPHLSVTAHGRKVFANQDKPTPYDPDGYIKRLTTDVPDIHPTILRYLQEAVGTFRAGSNLAAVVMLGAAAEKLLLELAAALPIEGNSKFATQVKSIIGWCTRNRKALPSPWNSESHVDDIDQIATFIRRRRNDAGHPQDPPAEPNREQMNAYLMVFPDYCKHIYTLKNWAESNPSTLPK